MGSATTLDRPNHRVEVTPSAVKATNIDASVTNGCVFLTFPDEHNFKVFTDDLDAKGVLYTRTADLTIRFFVRNNH